MELKTPITWFLTLFIFSLPASAQNGDTVQLVQNLNEHLIHKIVIGRNVHLTLSGGMQNTFYASKIKHCYSGDTPINVASIQKGVLFVDNVPDECLISNYRMDIRSSELQALSIQPYAEVILNGDLPICNKTIHIGEGATLKVVSSIAERDISFELEDGASLDLSDIQNGYVKIKAGEYTRINLKGTLKRLDMESKATTTIEGEYAYTQTDNAPRNTDTNTDAPKQSSSICQQPHFPTIIWESMFAVGSVSWFSPFDNAELPEQYNIATFFGGTRWKLSFSRFTIRWKRFSIHSGLEYESDIFHFHNNVLLNTNSDIPHIELAPDSIVAGHSRLVARYLSIPLLFSFQPFHNTDLSFTFGVVGGFNIRTDCTGFKRDYELTQNGITHLVKERSGAMYKNFAPFKLDARIGIEWTICGIYVECGLLPLFKSGREVKVIPISIGIGLGI